MSSFNDINGVLTSANAELLTDILRGEWKFPGVVISDYTADMELVAHGYAADDRDATAKAFTMRPGPEHAERLLRRAPAGPGRERRGADGGAG